MSYTEIVEAAKPPLLVQLISESKETLDGSGARARRTEALALHNEGMTMEKSRRDLASRASAYRRSCEKLAAIRQIPSGVDRRARREKGLRIPDRPWAGLASHESDACPTLRTGADPTGPKRARCPGSQRCAARLVIAGAVGLVNLAHIVGLMLFQTVRYRGFWRDFFARLSLYSTLAGLGASLLVD